MVVWLCGRGRCCCGCAHRGSCGCCIRLGCMGVFSRGVIGNGGWSRVGGCSPCVKCVYTVREIGNRRGNCRHERLEQLLHVGELLYDGGLVNF